MATFVAIAAAALVALVVFALTSGAPARADCIKLSFANTLGASEVKACGGKARRACANGAYPSLVDQMRAQCAHAGFPYRPR